MLTINASYAILSVSSTKFDVDAEACFIIRFTFLVYSEGMQFLRREMVCLLFAYMNKITDCMEVRYENSVF